MKKKYSIVLKVLFVIMGGILDSCYENVIITGEDMGQDEVDTIKFESDKYYFYIPESLDNSQWDAYVIKNDTVIAVKKDPLYQQHYYYISNLNDDENNGLVFVTNTDGEVLAYGNPNCMFHVYGNDKEFLFWMLEGDSIVSFTLPRTSQTKVKTRSVKEDIDVFFDILGNTNQISDVITGFAIQGDLGGVLTSASVGLQLSIRQHELSNKKYREFYENTSKMTLATGVSMLSGPAGAVIGGGFMAFDTLDRMYYEDFRRRYYGEDVIVEIASTNHAIRQNNDGTIDVTIVVDYTHSIPAWTRKSICVGVLARRDALPFYDAYQYSFNNIEGFAYDYNSPEVFIDLSTNETKMLTLTLPAMEAGNYWVRPYLRTNRNEIYGYKARVDGRKVLHGNAKNLNLFGYIKGYSITTSEQIKPENSLRFRYDVHAVGTSKDGNVEEWGLYEYLNGEVLYHRISSSPNGTVHFDESYNDYELNIEKKTATVIKKLGVYVKYNQGYTLHGDFVEIPLMHTFDEINICPDGNHPHAIDLGLGVTWSCCNVGASSPEDFGDYYSWGETSTKSDYSRANYEYFKDYPDRDYITEKQYKFIGYEIQGTEYDVAYVKWGRKWRMPTYFEDWESLQYCEHHWITYNGVQGELCIGPNKNAIFLPAAGRYLGRSKPSERYQFDFDPDCCSYWSATYMSSYWGCAYMYGTVEGLSWHTGGRSDGYSIRPIWDESE